MWSHLVGTMFLVLLSACGATPNIVGTSSDGTMRTRDAGVDPLPFQGSFDKAGQAVERAGFQGAVLASIQGLGLDQRGVVVSLLGGEWHFKYWVASQDKLQAVDVVVHVEGTQEVITLSDEKSKGTKLHGLNASRMLPPTKLVPQGISVGLKINPAGAQFNYFDITYNPDFADSAQPAVDVADVTANYRREIVDKIRMSATGNSSGGGTTPPVVHVPAGRVR